MHKPHLRRVGGFLVIPVRDVTLGPKGTIFGGVGNGRKPKKHTSPETKAKISESVKRYWVERKKRPVSVETRRKISAALKRSWEERKASL